MGKWGRKLQRSKASREPRKRFTLFCEGKNTEPAYFRALKTKYRNALIDWEILPAEGVPLTIAQNAVARKRAQKKKNLFEANDEVWAVFDRDIHPNYNQAVSMCAAHGVGVARTDPCFELWLILHFRDFDAPIDRHAIQTELAKICPEYDPDKSKNLDCKKLMESVLDAEQRAERQLSLRERENNAFGCPSTTVGALTQAIRTAAEKARSKP